MIWYIYYSKIERDFVGIFFFYLCDRDTCTLSLSELIGDINNIMIMDMFPGNLLIFPSFNIAYREGFESKTIGIAIMWSQTSTAKLDRARRNGKSSEGKTWSKISIFLETWQSLLVFHENRKWFSVV